MNGVTQLDLNDADQAFLERWTSKRSLWFVLLSLLLHASVVFFMSQDWSRFSGARVADEAAPVDVQVVPMTKEEMERLKTQIVETDLAQKSEKAAKDAYLGQQTQVVQRQSRARETAPFREGRVGGAKGSQSREQPRPTLSMGDLGVHMDFKPMGNLGPGQTASSNDYLKDVQQGSQTLLNTKEFAYFSFYQRVRHQLEQYWEPGLRERLKAMFERGRQLAADQEHSTHLTVVMNAEGSITRILVDSTSGLIDLDRAAIDAFNKAGPFPNPPRGMIEADGTVKVEWEFVLKT